DQNRKGLFHYVLYGHARGTPKSEFPCLNPATNPPTPTGYDTAGTCAPPLAINPDFHVPVSFGGIADLPGGNALVTLGRWEEFVARPFVRASMTFHELGHNLNLWHGGLPAIIGNKALNTATFAYPNCKPPYLSSMSYAFLVHGLFDNSDDIHL